MHGKRILITGATSGIGRVAALQLAAMGADLVFTARDPAKAQALTQELRAAAPDAAVDHLLVDLSLMEEVKRAAEEFKRRYDRLDVLVNNAGALYMQRETTAEGIERTLATNHLSPFLLTRELLDVLRASAPARVVTVASRAHKDGTLTLDDLQRERGYRGWPAYRQSKLANILFTRELARRLEGSGVTATALHPGLVATGFGLNSPGPFRFAWKHLGRFFTTPEEGARTIVYLASSQEVEGHSGGYYVECKEASPSAEAQDDARARLLWEASERLLAERGL